ncbi:sugar transferase [Ascidiimonas sp. W6]|uniref:sugar transferase n=1 Tax=Ascidiimonas meishanensis TaxID=3128903 RepID=UPI0030EF4FDC
MNNRKAQILKRSFDISLSVFLLIILFIPGLLLTLILAGYFRENPFFQQKRIGQNAQEFVLYKFRSIKGDIPISMAGTHLQISGISKWTLKYKLNELPQLVNILIGDMSFVGPRPDVKGFADKLKGEDRIILEVKPGLTGPATLKYRNELSMLSKQSNPEVFNREIIWPDKVKINRNYIENWSFIKDIQILLKTLFPFLSFFNSRLQ